MHIRKMSTMFRKLSIGLRRRCPECERGQIFASHFQINATCAYCGVRFERSSGDAVGGVYINVAVAEFTAMTGFFLVHTLFHPPMLAQLFIWIPYVLVFSILFYPYARGLWVGVMYLTGGIYRDPDYEREYIASSHVYGTTTWQEPE